MADDKIASLADRRRAKGISPYRQAQIQPEADDDGVIYHRVSLSGHAEATGISTGGRSVAICATWHDARLLVGALLRHHGPMTVLDKSVLTHGDVTQLNPPAAFVMVSPEGDSFSVVACPDQDLGGWFAPYRTGLSQHEAETLVHVLSIRLNLPILGLDDDGGEAA